MLTCLVAHYLHQATQQAYNGVKITKKELIQDFGDEDHEHKYPTINRNYSQSFRFADY